MARNAQEATVRRMAQRQGLTVTKSRRRDPRALDYARWTLTTSDGRTLTEGTLTDMKRWLLAQPTRAAS
jgi:hypothetical protein